MKPILAVLLILATGTAAAAQKSPVDECKAFVERQLAKVEKEMRAGYKEPRGSQLRKRRSELSKIRHECNSNPAAWKKAR